MQNSPEAMHWTVNRYPAPLGDGLPGQPLDVPGSWARENHAESVSAISVRLENDGFCAVNEAAPGLNGRALPAAVSCELMPALNERGGATIVRLFALRDEYLSTGVFLS